MKFAIFSLFATMVACAQADSLRELVAKDSKEDDNLGNLTPKEMLGAAGNQAHHDRRLHGTEVQHCFTADGDLRIFVAHWHHGEGITDSTAGTMTIQQNHMVGQPSTMLSATGSVENAVADSLPGCVGSATQASTCSDVSNPFNDWVWFDFPITCNVPFDYMLLSGDTIYLTAACEELYPATISGNVACVTDQPSSSPTSLPSSSPTTSPTSSPTSGPTDKPSSNPTTSPTSSPTSGPTDKPSSNPTTSPTDQPTGSPTTSPSNNPTVSPTVTPPVLSFASAVCENFAVHARTAITFGAPTIVTGGDVGISDMPGTSITGIHTIIDGVKFAGATAEEKAFAARGTISWQEAMAVRTDGTENTLVTAPIGMKTFTPGTYRSGATISTAAADIVTLDGLNQDNAVFLFQATSTLGMGAGTTFRLINGARAENVVWAVGTAVTLGAGVIIPGTILAGSAFTTGALSRNYGGCVIAQTAITFSGDTALDMGSGPWRTRQLRGY